MRQFVQVVGLVVALGFSACSSSDNGGNSTGGAGGTAGSTGIGGMSAAGGSGNIGGASGSGGSGGSGGPVDGGTGRYVGADAGPLPVDGGKLLVALTPAEQAAVCDWIARMSGGYGSVRTYSCEASTVTFEESKSQTDCIAASRALLPACTATLQQAADCLAEQFRDPCGFDVSAICQVYYVSLKTCE
jgi:hypothetical protein